MEQEKIGKCGEQTAVHQFLIYQLLLFVISCSYTCSSFVNILSTNWFRLAHLPIFYSAKISHIQYYLWCSCYYLVVSSQLPQWSMVDVPHTFVNNSGNITSSKKLQTSIASQQRAQSTRNRHLGAIGLAIEHSFCTQILVARRVPNTSYTNNTCTHRHRNWGAGWATAPPQYFAMY